MTIGEGRPHDRGIVLIVAFKLVKAILLLGVALGAIGLVHRGVTDASSRLLAAFSSGTERRVTQSVISRLSGMSPRRIEALGIGAFLYALLFLIEAAGLWLQKRWAEYLTSIATGSFIPFEIYELVQAVTAARIATLAANSAVVIYLIVRLRRYRREKGA
jgi:uncharacterized membrane protein (DUF2068 family)